MGDDDNWIDVQHKELLDALFKIRDAIVENTDAICAQTEMLQCVDDTIDKVVGCLTLSPKDKPYIAGANIAEILAGKQYSDQ